MGGCCGKSDSETSPLLHGGTTSPRASVESPSGARKEPLPSSSSASSGTDTPGGTGSGKLGRSERRRSRRKSSSENQVDLVLDLEKDFEDKEFESLKTGRRFRLTYPKFMRPETSVNTKKIVDLNGISGVKYYSSQAEFSLTETTDTIRSDEECEQLYTKMLKGFKGIGRIIVEERNEWTISGQRGLGFTTFQSFVKPPAYLTCTSHLIFGFQSTAFLISFSSYYDQLSEDKAAAVAPDLLEDESKQAAFAHHKKMIEILFRVMLTSLSFVG